MTNFKAYLDAAFDNDKDVTYVYGTISDIEGAEIMIKDNGSIVVEGSAAQYYYNNEGSKAKLEAGDCFGLKIDEAGDDGANYVFARLYDGDVIDIVTFSARVK